MVSLKLTPLCTIALLLLFALTCASAAAARPPPPSSSAAPHDDAPPKSSRPLQDVEWEEEESCEGGEECLMRRSAEAHLDYIYSQNLKP